MPGGIIPGIISQVSMSASAIDPLQWGNSEVLAWLEGIRDIDPSTSAQVVEQFRAHSIIGKDLFILSRDDLIDLSVTRVPDIRRIRNAIDDLRASVDHGSGDSFSSSVVLEDIVSEFPTNLDQAPTSDEDYWQRVECSFVLRLLLLRTRSELAIGRTDVDDDRATSRSNTLHQRRMAMEQLLQSVESSMSIGIGCDEATSDTPPGWSPVLAKVMNAYQMSEEELDVLRFIVTVKITKSALLRSILPSDDHAETPLVEDKCTCSLVQYVCSISQLQIGKITEESRPLVKDRILGEMDEDVLGSEFKFAVPDEVCRVLLGLSLSTEDKLKLAGTRMESICGDEKGGLEHKSRAGSFRSRASVVASASTSDHGHAMAQRSVEKMLDGLAAQNEGGNSNDDEAPGDSDEASGLEDTFAALMEETENRLDNDDEISDHKEPRVYTGELDYLSDQFSLIMQQIQISSQRLQRDMKQASLDGPPRWMRNEGGRSISIGELSAKVKLARRKIELSLELTRKEGKFFPRLEELVTQLKLDEFEKSVMLYLAGSMISPLFKSSIESTSYRGSGRKCSVGDLLQVFCFSVSEQVAARTYFYRTAKMVDKGLVRLAETYGATDLSDQDVVLDRRVLDCIVGLDKESTEVAQGSHLYDPTVDLDSVVLAPGLKESILSSVKNFDKFRAFRKQSSFDEVVSYGVGLTLMFSGSSGTGKTMMANALAKSVGKKLLLVDFPRLSQQSNGKFQSIFREAELSNAICFFDECESLFMKRDSGGSSHLAELLVQMEKFEGICLLATNRPFDLDEAFFRRISECFEFKPPNHVERREIWRIATSHEAIPCDESIDLDDISLKYELTGGYIKNAVISALQLAVGRNSPSPMVTENDIVEGCKKQMRGALQMAEFDERVVPLSGLDDLIVSDEVKDQLKAIVSIEKARGVLFGQFGFDDSMRGCQGTTALFWGPRGSGKQDAAEAIGFELGKPLKVTDLPQLLGKSGKANASTVKECFKEARLMDAVLVLGGISLNASEGQRGSSSVEDIRLLNLVVREMTRFPGICIMQIDVVDSLDIFVSRLEKGLLDGLKYLVPFHYPDMYCRKKLWKKRLPDTLPKKSLDYSELARLSDELNTTQIGNAVYRSAAQAALKDENSRFVTMADLRSAIEKERQRGVSAVDRYVRAQYI